MAPRHKDSDSVRTLLVAAARMEQLEIVFWRASEGRVLWQVTLEKAEDAAIEIVRILRKQRQVHRDFIREHGTAVVLEQAAGSVSQRQRQKIEQWYTTVKRVHASDVNDPWLTCRRRDIEDMKTRTELLDRIIVFYQDNVYHPFLQIHRDMPHHPIWEVHESLSRVNVLLQHLREDVYTANVLARALQDGYTTFQGDLCAEEQARSPPFFLEWVTSMEEPSTASEAGSSRYCFTTPKLGPAKQRDRSRAIELLPSADSPLQAATNASLLANEKAKHKRAATTTYYVPTGPPAFGSVVRRHGRSVPRIFTGSFSELEQSLHGLKLEAANKKQAEHASGMKRSAESVLSSFPMGPGEDEMVMLSRRGGADRRQPQGRRRAKMLDDMTDHLASWLDERPPPVPPLPPNIKAMYQ